MIGDERTLPHDLEAERAILGAIQLHNEAYDVAAPIVRPEDFYRHAHTLIFRSMQCLHEAGTAIDLITLKADLGGRGELDVVGGPAYLAALVDGMPRSTNVEHYAKIVVAKARARALIYAGNNLRAAAYDDDTDRMAFAVAHVADAAAGLAIDLSRGGSGFDGTDLGDLLAEPDEIVQWLVQDRIRAGGVCMLAGKPKAGKSTLARDLALQVARGGSWLGWRCTAGVVWYLCYEDQRDDVRAHFRRMGASHDPVRLFFPNTGADIMRQIHRQAMKERPALIVVDTMQRLVSVRELNDYAEVTKKLAPILELAKESGAAVLLVHHASKGERQGIDAVLGSTALTGSCANIFFFSRNEQYRTFRTSQRVGPELPEMIVTLDAETGRSHLGPSRQSADVATLADEMLAFLEGAPAPMTEPELEKHVGGKTSLKRRALRDLLDQNRVHRVGKGRAGEPFRYVFGSRSLVPSIVVEQENKTLKTAKQARQHRRESCSQAFPVLTSASGAVVRLAVAPAVDDGWGEP